MTLVDSVDSCIMLYSYAGFPEKGWSLIKKSHDVELSASANIPTNGYEGSDGERFNVAHQEVDLPSKGNATTSLSLPPDPKPPSLREQRIPGPRINVEPATLEERIGRKHHAMSSLSIVLTLISILVRTLQYIFMSVGSFLVMAR